MQTPNPYTGDVLGAAAIVQQWQWPGPTVYNPYTPKIWPDGYTVIKIMFRSQDVSYPKIQLGDRIQFSSGGTYGPGFLQ